MSSRWNRWLEKAPKHAWVAAVNRLAEAVKPRRLLHLRINARTASSVTRWQREFKDDE